MEWPRLASCDSRRIHRLKDPLIKVRVKTAFFTPLLWEGRSYGKEKDKLPFTFAGSFLVSIRSCAPSLNPSQSEGNPQNRCEFSS